MEVWLHVEHQLTRHSKHLIRSTKDLMMELFLQFGFGMMEHCRSLVKSWGGGTVVLSPRDLSRTQLESLSKDILKLGGKVLLDPQLYHPEVTNHERLITHCYWPKSNKFPIGAALKDCLSNLIEINRSIGARQLILPGMIARKVDADWLENQRLVIEETQRCDVGGMDPILTVALGYDAVKNDAQVEALLEAIPTWEVNSIYLVCEHPNGDYLVPDPSWLANIADIVAGTRMAGKTVIVGYSNHQLLLVACSAASAIVSGTWMNVRSFNHDKFISQDDDEIKQRSTWYYAPHLFSEYKISYLDLANKSGVLATLQTHPAYGSTYADELFSAPQPNVADFTEQQAFRHYLQCLQHQASTAIKTTFDETIQSYFQQLESAEKNLNFLHGKGIKGQKRDFLECIDANRGAVDYLVSARGSLLRRNWSKLIA